MNTFNNPIGWFEIQVADMERACNFYEYVFKQKLTDIPSGDPSIKIMAFTGDMKSHGTNGALVLHQMKTPSTDGVLIYFSCDDCSVQEKRALEKGGQVFKSKFRIGPNGFISSIGDSEGNAIGLQSCGGASGSRIPRGCNKDKTLYIVPLSIISGGFRYEKLWTILGTWEPCNSCRPTGYS